MRTILHTIDTTGPGGAETVFIDLASKLPKQRYRSLVLIRDKGWVYEELQRRGFKPILLDAKGSFNWRYLRGLVSLLRENQVDLVQSHLLGANVYCALAGLLARVPVVATFHGAVDIGLNERLKALKFAAINIGTDVIVAVSSSLKQDIIGRTPLRASKTRIIYNGIDTGDFQRDRSDALRQRFGWSSQDIIIGSLGNVRTAKAYDVLLHAAAALEKRSDRYKFVIAGQGKEGLLDELLVLRQQLGLESSVQFLGFHDDPAEFLSNLDLFLLSSTSEGFSIATIQAMAASLPVIVTRSGGPEEIVTHDEDGWLVEAGSAEAIVQAIDMLSQDTERCQRLAQNARQHAVANFDIDAMLQGYMSIYDKLIR